MARAPGVPAGRHVAGRGPGSAARWIELWIPLIYAAVSVSWIAVSDVLVLRLAHSPREQALLSVWKGVGFVCLTACLLYFGIRWGMGRERRARERAERSEAMLAEAGRLARLGAWYMDLGGQHQPVWSDEVYAILGCRPGADQPSRELLLARVHPDDRELVRRGLQAALPDRRSVHLEFRVLREDGAEHHVVAQGALLPDHGDGTPTWMVGALQDVTEQKRLERTLAEADRRKSEFLALLSHELRNPLAPIRNALYLLERAEPGTAPFDRARETLARQVGHLGRLVDDLLDATRISRGMFQVHRSRLDLADLVVNVLRDHEDQFEAARITCDAQLSGEPVPVNGDTTRLAQVIGNLLSNAMKFTRPGGHVRVRLEPTPARIASLVVSDDGEGVPAELLPHLFKPFVQAGQGLSRTRGGLGLGLSVVRALVEAHGGRAWARSDGVGRGAQFAIELPMAEEEPILREPPRQSAGIPRRRVLVIEDNEDAAETLREMLVLWDQDVEVAHDGLEGLEKARTCRPDLVLCDIGLPTMSGFEVAKAIRADPVLASTYLVAVTGYATAEDRRRAADAGFDRHLGKPVPVEVVEEVVSSVPVSDAGQPLH